MQTIFFVMVTHKFYRHFFHASEDRHESADYNDPDSEDDEMEDEQPKLPSRGTVAGLKQSTTPEREVDPCGLVDRGQQGDGH